MEENKNYGHEQMKSLISSLLVLGHFGTKHVVFSASGKGIIFWVVSLISFPNPSVTQS